MHAGGGGGSGGDDRVLMVQERYYVAVWVRAYVDRATGKLYSYFAEETPTSVSSSEFVVRVYFPSDSRLSLSK